MKFGDSQKGGGLPQEGGRTPKRVGGGGLGGLWRGIGGIGEPLLDPPLSLLELSISE